MNRSKVKYIFNYWTGYGIYEISSHTIDFYPITISVPKDTDELEVIVRALTKASKLAKYNRCYLQQGVIPVIKEGKIGLCFLSKKIITWEGGQVFWQYPVLQEVKLQSFILPGSQYPNQDSSWTKNYCTGKVFESQEAWNEYVRERKSKSKL